jgi:hypothetical protein
MKFLCKGSRSLFFRTVFGAGFLFRSARPENEYQVTDQNSGPAAVRG